MNRDYATDHWSRACRGDGWFDLTALWSLLPEVSYPACGLGGCSTRASILDPSGVGWCHAHTDQGLHGAPPPLPGLPDFDGMPF